jgi:DNA-binding NarL/FixJ family response regulator
MGKEDGKFQKSSAFRLLIVDDYPVERMGLWAIVSMLYGFEVCGTVTSCEDGIERIDALHPDVVTIDLHDGQESKLNCIRSIRAKYPELPVMVVAIEEELGYADDWLAAGAACHVRKDDGFTSIGQGLVKALRSVGIDVPESAGTSRMDGNSNDWADVNLDMLDHLTAREFEVFDVLGSGMTTKEAADLLNISEKTVESHRESIKSKLGLESFTQFMRWAVEWHLRSTKGDDVPT